MATSAHATSITAPGISGGLVTSVSISNSKETLDCSHLGLATGSGALLYEAPFDNATEVSVAYIGDSIPDSGDEGALTISGSVSVSFANCLVVSASTSGAAGELIMADVTYREILE